MTQMSCHSRHMPTDETDRRFARNLRNARERSGLSLAQVARTACLDARTVWRIERGENSPRIDTANSLAIAVGSTLQELLEHTGPADQAPTVASRALPKG